MPLPVRSFAVWLDFDNFLIAASRFQTILRLSTFLTSCMTLSIHGRTNGSSYLNIHPLPFLSSGYDGDFPDIEYDGLDGLFHRGSTLRPHSRCYQQERGLPWWPFPEFL